MIKKKEVLKILILMGLPGIFGILATWGLLIYDKPIIKLVASTRNPILDYMFLSISIVSNIFIIYFFIMTIFFFTYKRRRWAVALTLSIIFTYVYGIMLKMIFSIPRPFETGVVKVFRISYIFMQDNFSTWNRSFPSLHAMVVFSILPFLGKEFKTFKRVWIVFAVLVALSRMYFGIHYLTDIVIGGIIGYIIGTIFITIEEKTRMGSTLMKKINHM